MSSSTITIKRNNDRNLNLTFTKDGDPFDITGSTIWMAVKEKRSDPDEDAVFIKEVTSHTDPSGGLSTIGIAASDTATAEIGKYFYDILLIDSLGKRQSSETGNFFIEQEVTDGE